MPELYKSAVIGNPIAHSLSPDIHTEFAKQFDFNITMDKILIESNNLESQLNNLIKNNYIGAAVTLPIKTLVYDLCDSTSERAQLAGAVSTIKFYNNKILGDNTDGIGLVNDLERNHKIDLTSQNILLIGAGGAARGVIQPLLSKNPNNLFITNRTHRKAQELENKFINIGNIKSVELNNLDKLTNINLIINASSASVKNQIPELPKEIIKNSFCYDMMYLKNKITSFNQFCSDNGAVGVADGLGMLMEHSACVFEWWYGVRPETKNIIS